MRFQFTCLILLLITINLQAQQSMNMTLLDTWEDDSRPAPSGVQFNEVWGYVDCEGNEFAIIGSSTHIHFIDLADPMNLVQIDSFAGGETTVWRDMKTYKDRAYAVSDNTNEGLMIFDLSDLPNSITKSYHSTAFFGKSHNIFIDEENGRLYSVGTDTQNGGVIVLDLNDDPDNPSLMASVNLPANPSNGQGYAHDIYVRDNIAYGSHGYLGFFIWDMTDPTTPILLASQNTGGYNHSSWVSEEGDFAIYAEEVPIGRPLGVINLENLDNEFIEIDTTFKFPLNPNDDNNRPHNPFIRGDYLFCSYYHDGIQVFDVSDPLNPFTAAYYDTNPSDTAYAGFEGNWGTYPFLPSGLILASDVSTGLYVLEMDQSISLLNIAPPTTPDISTIFPSTLDLCDGENGTFEVPDGFEKYTWYKDSEVIDSVNFFFEISESGTYYAVINNKQCESISNEMVVTFNESPDISNLNTEDVVICDGQAFTYEVPDGYEAYNWTKNGDTVSTTNSILIDGTGTYQLITSNNGCESVSEEFEVTFSFSPPINITPSGPTEFCQGGFVSLDAALIGNYSYIWSFNNETIDSTAEVEVTESGFYSLLVINEDFGCEAFGTIEITVYEPVIPEIVLDGNLLTSTEANYYQWFQDGTILPNSNNQQLNVMTPGDYYVGTVDTNGCFGNSNVITIETVAINDLVEIKEFSIFPNPVNELLFAKIELERTMDFQVEIISTTGQILKEQNRTFGKNDFIEMNISSFPNGVYFIKLKNKNGSIIRRFIKM
ncbi:MAG: choice-of-anchor B family protein [Saprospiraceae bacterium]